MYPIIFGQYPDKSQMGWPTYIICDAADDEFQEYKVVGEVKGGHPKDEFRSLLQEVLSKLA